MLRARILSFIREDIREAFLDCELPSEIISQIKKSFRQTKSIL